ncbi:type I restriction endonuclease [Bacillus velezensis]|uniref:type I restriction endonuclease n=1 Tax=Bacillus velezensis TaxID=492670 RepID=UPI00237F6156|nr:type I restriction endonuclease [Bacillus velezensis]WDV42161.1 type I restriction endonuclease [Bacillus velezensis]
MSNRSRLYESDFEETTIERLKNLGYEYIPAYGWGTRSSLSDVVMEKRLEKYLYDTYPTFPKEHMPALISQITNVDGVTVEQRNERFHEVLTKGIDFKIEQESDENQFYHISPINWEKPLENDFVAMNQLAIEGRMSRRPDIIVYINGLPLILFELKSPYIENTTVQDAYTQVKNYTYDIAQLFNYNAFSVISDGTTTLHGMPFAPIEFFAAWKSIDGVRIDNNIANTMKTLIEGLFQKDRLLNYIRNFIVFMDNGKTKAKIGAKYHQFWCELCYQRIYSSNKTKWR